MNFVSLVTIAGCLIAALLFLSMGVYSLWTTWRSPQLIEEMANETDADSIDVKLAGVVVGAVAFILSGVFFYAAFVNMFDWWRG